MPISINEFKKHSVDFSRAVAVFGSEKGLKTFLEKLNNNLVSIKNIDNITEKQDFKLFLNRVGVTNAGDFINRAGVTKAGDFINDFGFLITKEVNPLKFYNRFKTFGNFSEEEKTLLKILQNNPRIKRVSKILGKNKLSAEDKKILRDRLIRFRNFSKDFITKAKNKRIDFRKQPKKSAVFAQQQFEEFWEMKNPNWRYAKKVETNVFKRLTGVKRKGLGVETINFVGNNSEQKALNRQQTTELEKFFNSINKNTVRNKAQLRSLIKYFRSKRFKQPQNLEQIFHDSRKQPLNERFKKLIKTYLHSNPEKARDILSKSLPLLNRPKNKPENMNDLLALREFYHDTVNEFIEGLNIQNPFQKELKRIQSMLNSLNKNRTTERKYLLDGRKDLRDAHLSAMGETCFSYKGEMLDPLDKDFHAIKIIDAETGRCDGVIHTFTRQINGKKVMILGGFELRNRLTTNENTTKNRFQKILKGLEIMAKKKGFAEIHSTTRPAAISNRETISKIITAQQKRKLEHQIYGKKHSETHLLSTIQKRKRK